MQYLLISVRTYSSRLVIFGTVDIWAVGKRPVSLLYRPPSSLVEKMPVKASERPVLLTFVLKKELALLGPKLFQIPVGERITRI